MLLRSRAAAVRYWSLGRRDGLHGIGGMISVCVLTRHRSRLLASCLDSLRTQTSDEPWELVVCSDGDPFVAAEVLSRFPDAVVGTIDRRGAPPGQLRNLLVERAHGDLLLFLDDDVVARPDLLATLARLAREHPDAAVFGGPNLTPPGSSRFQFVQGAVLASTFGSGPVRRRYHRAAPGAADERFFTLCNLAVRKDAMRRFPPGLICAEENAVLDEMSRQGLAMHYDPELVVYHERRPTGAQFAKQMLKYGRGRGQLTSHRPRTLRLSYVVPAALVLYLLAVPLLARVGMPALAPLGLYVAALAAASVRVGVSFHSVSALVLAAPLFVAVHLSYGVGFWGGLAVDGRRRPPSSPDWLPTESDSTPVGLAIEAAPE